MQMHTVTLRVREAVKEGCRVIDVDGSYLYRKHQQMKQQSRNVAPLGLPPPPVSGWELVCEDNHRDISSRIPKVTQGKFHITYCIPIFFLCALVGTVYTYLAEGVGRKVSEQGGTFRALARGYTRAHGKTPNQYKQP
jgi:hypothetical protein